MGSGKDAARSGSSGGSCPSKDCLAGLCRPTVGGRLLAGGSGQADQVEIKTAEHIPSSRWCSAEVIRDVPLSSLWLRLRSQSSDPIDRIILHQARENVNCTYTPLEAFFRWQLGSHCSPRRELREPRVAPYPWLSVKRRRRETDFRMAHAIL